MITSTSTTSKLLHPPTPNLHMDNNSFYKFLLELWNRSGGYQPSTTNLVGLKSSVNEINTLVGVNTTTSVQTQLNGKLSIVSVGTMAYENSTAVNITGGSLSGVSIGSSTQVSSTYSAVTINSGTIGGCTVTFPTGSATTAASNGSIFTNVANAGNNLAVETILLHNTILANTLNINGKYLEVTAFGTVASNGNSKEIKLKIGTTALIDTGAVLANGGSWEIKSIIIRTSSANLKCSTTVLSDNTLILPASNYVLATEDTTTALDIFCTGTGVADDDIVQEGLIIKYFN